VRDVAIVGAGPAGLESARVLASLGHDVLVLEEHPTVGDPVHCTGLFGLDAFSEFDIPRECVLGTADGAEFVAADGSSVVVSADAVRAVVVDRARFDQSLADASVGAGAELRAGARVRSITVESTHVVLTFDDQPPVHARACIVACGASYRLNRQLGLGVPRTFVQSAQLERPFDGPEHVEVHLGREVAPSGFAWLVPFTRAGKPFNRVGLMCDTRAAPRFRAFAGRVRDRFGVPEDGWPEPRLKILPLGPVSRTYGTRVLAVGDAAGLVKPTTGGGIYYGLISGRFAAGTLDGALREDDLSDTRLRAYESEWRGRLGAEIRTGLAFRTLVARMNDRSIDALIELARIDGLIPLLRQTADFNWHRRSALALLRHAQFRRILLSSIWS
jgi:digeranylgeranylglycerophospholipid reductase